MCLFFYASNGTTGEGASPLSGEPINIPRIKVNETKNTQVIYTLRRSDCPHVYLDNIEIARANVAKYLGLHLDRKVTWKVHIEKKGRRRI